MSTRSVTARAASLGVSGLIWVGLGALVLTQAPQVLDFTPAGPPAIQMEPRIIIPPEPPLPPEPVIRDKPPEAPTLPAPFRPDPVAERPPPTVIPGVVPAGPSDLPTGPTADQPAVAGPAPEPSGGTLELPLAPPAPEPVVPPQPAPPPVILNPVRIAGADPVFPERALEAGRSGVVTLAFLVGADGRVSDLEVIGESPGGFGFARAARTAVARWTFQPQMIDGTATPYRARYTIRFEMAD
jgi:protein TonB